MNQVMTVASSRGIDWGSNRSCTTGQSGFALITSLLILVVLTLVVVTGLRLSIVEEQVSGNQKMAATALFGAEQGVSQALSDLFAATISDTGSESDINWSASNSISGTGYTSSYMVRHLVRSGAQVEDDDGRRYFIIDSSGETSTGEAERVLEVGVALEWGGDSNVAGLIGCDGVTGLSNFTTASYSSTDPLNQAGDRGDVATTGEGVLMYLDGSSGHDILGEIRSTGALFMDNNAAVRRDILANLRITVKNGDVFGSAYTNDSFHDCTSCVHGDIFQGPTVMPDPLVPFPQCDPWDIDAIFAEAASIKNSNNNGDAGLSNGHSYDGSPEILGSGGGKRDYYFTDFYLDNKTAYITGEVRIYVYNDFTMKADALLILNAGASLKVYVEAGNAWIDSNSKVNHDPSDLFPNCSPGGCPIKMHLYSKHADNVKDHKVTSSFDVPNVWDDSQDLIGVKIDSNSVFYGIVYAPRSHVWLGSNVQFSGSARGRFVTADSNLAFMYDEDLDTLYSGNPTDYKLVYWTEKYPE
jgi:hypothetical protein